MYYRQPRYMNDFKCVGGTCTSSCCIGWRIDWTEEEIDKVKNAPECSEELKALCESSFKYDENYKLNIVTLGEKGRCPFLTEDNFCKIQRELGAEYLSYTCTIYPRHYFLTSSAAYRYCNMTCPEIMKKLLNDDKCMDLVNAEIKGSPRIKPDINYTPENVAKHPEWKYADDIKEFFYEIISNKKLPLETCIILGGLAAQSLTKLTGIGDYDKIPEAIKTLRSQMHNAEQLKSIENIKTNYNVKLGVTDKLIRKYFKSVIANSFIDKAGKPNIDIYRISEVLLEKEFKSRPFVWRNIALNLMLELNVPFYLQDKTIFENYSVFVMAYAFMRHNALAVVESNARLGKNRSLNIQDTIVSFSAALSRRLCHNPENLKKILQDLKDFKMTSPAYLALLVK